MKKFFTVLIFILTSNFIYSQSGWFSQNSGTTDALFDVYFFDNNTGLIIGGDAINLAVVLRTTNGGANWDSIPINTTVLLRGMDFVNSSTGIIVGGNSTLSVIFKTTNSGLNWEQIGNPTSDALRSVSFPPTGTGFIGYACGFNGRVLKTENGGNSWKILNTNISSLQLFSIHFTDPNTGTAVGGSQIDTSLIIRTTDGGITWIRQNPNTTVLLRGVYFINSNSGFAVGNAGTILRTSDGGVNWTVQSATAGLFLRDVYFADAITGFIVGSQGKILKTTNGGNNWETLQSGVSNDLQAVHFANAFVGSSVGFDGTVVRTNSGGINSATNHKELVSDSYALYQNYPNPFNPATVINYQLPEDAFVKLTVYDILGNEVAELENSKQSAGNYSVKFEPENLSSGIYFYKLETGEFTDIKPMMLLK